MQFVSFTLYDFVLCAQSSFNQSHWKKKKMTALNRSSSSFRFNESWYRQAGRNKVIFVTLKLIKKRRKLSGFNLELQQAQRGSSAGLHAVLRAMKAPVIAGTPHGKDVLMAHLSDAVICQGSQSPVNYPILVVPVRVVVTLAEHCPSKTCTNTTSLPQNNSVAVIKGLHCFCCSSSARPTIAAADRINPQLGAPKRLTPPPPICLRLTY